ncbi:hypothetical protein Tco_0206160 [Tanacetum coccineum]
MNSKSGTKSDVTGERKGWRRSYKLERPEELMLVTLDGTYLDDKTFIFVEIRLEMWNRDVKRLKRVDPICFRKVRCELQRGPSSRTGEREDLIQEDYPHLFTQDHT